MATQGEGFVRISNRNVIPTMICEPKWLIRGVLQSELGRKDEAGNQKIESQAGETCPKTLTS
jgi:hypothetical protein